MPEPPPADAGFHFIDRSLTAARPEAVTSGHAQLQPGSYISVSVTDTGEGMDEATISKAFDPFFTTKEVGKGTGLGLPMVHDLAQQSGGQLILRSQKGKGTRAEIWLPVAEAHPEAPVATVREAAPSKATQELTILAVDDDSLVLTNMSAMLADLGRLWNLP